VFVGECHSRGRYRRHLDAKSEIISCG
jgi:hypothetical protein